MTQRMTGQHSDTRKRERERGGGGGTETTCIMNKTKNKDKNYYEQDQKTMPTGAEGSKKVSE